MAEYFIFAFLTAFAFSVVLCIREIVEKGKQKPW